MQKAEVLGFSLTLLILGSCISTFYILPARPDPTIIVVPDDYPTITEAISNANGGDTVFVKNGTYREHIEIGKPLILIGESNQNTILKVERTSTWNVGIRITDNNVSLVGFKITYDVAPIILVMIDGREGACDSDTIKDNIIVNKGTDALYASNTTRTSILHNSISNDQDGSCVFLTYSNSSIIDNNTMSGGWTSMWCSDSNNNTISLNAMTNQTLYYDSGAITLATSSKGNVITGNNVTENQCGISVFNGPSKNTIFNNNFIDNAKQAFWSSLYANDWDNGYPLGGNYWSDYASVDLFRGPFQNISGSDGIGDSPRVLDANNTDRYPLMSPWTVDVTPPQIQILSPLNQTYSSGSVPLTFQINEITYWIGYSLDDASNATVEGNTTLIHLPDGQHHVTVFASDMAENIGASHTVYFVVETVIHDIAINSISFSKEDPEKNETILIYVTVQNKGNINETFNVNLNYTRFNDPLIGTQLTTLTPGQSVTINFTWTPVRYGAYKIEAYATGIPDDVSLSDNFKFEFLAIMLLHGPFYLNGLEYWILYLGKRPMRIT